ncbi:iron-sulfur cluster assembly scaffold protein [Metamycoplasma buccale]|uniref:iron-sulfur cluster assembly scaffold protein n=1 Tax=Metamycoplasma buccale TaxID=55602 RepID=UPI00398E87EC
MNILTFYNNKEKQEIIFSAYNKPKYKTNNIVINDNTIFEHSNVCVDDLKLNLIWKDDILVNVEYEISGCAIFSASVDLMIDLIINKSKKSIKKIIDLYFFMINGKKLNDEEIILLEKLMVFENVKVHYNRLECASIIHRALLKVLNDK